MTDLDLSTLDFDALTPADLRARGSAKWNRYPDEVLPAWVAEMDFPTAEPVLRAVREAVARESFGYPLTARQSGLDRVLADHLARTQGWTVDPGSVHLVADVMHGVRLALQFVAEPGPVVVPTPVYMPFFEFVELAGHEVVEVPVLGGGEEPWALDVHGIDAALAAGARTVLLSNPHNPLGVAWPREQLAALAAVVDRHGALVVTDEIHAPLVFDRPHQAYADVAAEAPGHTITVTSASKAWNVPGLKCAQVVTTDPGHTATWNRIPHEATVGVGTLGIAANRAAYEEGAAWLAAVVERLSTTRHEAAKALSDMGIGHRTNDSTYLLWLDCRDLGLGADPATWFLEHAGVALSPGPPFRPATDGFARLNLATTTPLLDQLLGRMGDALARRRGQA